MPKAEIQKRVSEAAKMLGLEQYLKRKPAALSGGQRQRVAMGRAIVREPQAFLMDEPLSNLDAKLRVSMRASLNQLHERLGVTTVYVTHDQVEAMTLGDRVCVLRDGLLQQVDTPQNLFDKPVNLFVAGFMGSPVDELRHRRAGPRRRRRRTSPSPTSSCRCPESTFADKPGLDQYFGKKIILGIRPSDFEDAPRPRPRQRLGARMPVRAEVTEELGSEINVLFLIDAPPVEHKDTVAAADAGDDEEATAPAGRRQVAVDRPRQRPQPRPPRPDASSWSSTRTTCTSSTPSRAWPSATRPTPVVKPGRTNREALAVTPSYGEGLSPS